MAASDGPAATGPPERLLLLTSEAERRALLDERPELRSAETVAALCREVPRAVWDDLERAQRLASTAMWLAEELDHPHSRALAERALATVLYFQRDHALALEHYLAAVDLFATLGDERQEAVTRSSGLLALLAAGCYTEALEWAAAARRVFERHGDRLRLARLESNLGLIESRRDRYRQACEHYLSAYELFREVGSPVDISSALRNIAVSQQMLNNFGASLDAYHKARAHAERHHLSKQAMEIEYNIAYLYYLRGEYTRALHLYEKARQNCERLGDRYHTALCDLDLSEIYLELNLVDEAWRLSTRGHQGFEQLGLDYEAAKSLTVKAIATQRRGDAIEALALLDEAREIFVHEENTVWVALIDLYRAELLRSGGRTIEAERLAQRALVSFERAGLPGKSGVCRLLLARLALDRAEPELARSLCATALAELDGLGLPALAHQVHYVDGRAAEALGDEAGAAAAYRRSHQELEKLRGHLRSDELKIAFLEDKLAVYEALVALALEGEAESRDPGAAFAWIETAKSRSLADLLSFGSHVLPSTTGRGDLVEKMRALRDELSSLNREIDNEELSGVERDRSRIATMRALTRRREGELLRVLRRLQAGDPQFRSLQDSIAVDLDTVRGHLLPGTMLLEYFIARDTVYLCLLDGERLQIEPVSPVDRVRQLHHQLRLQLSKFRLGPDYVEAFEEVLSRSTDALLRRLYDELIGAVEDRLQADHLVIVGHDFLHYTPFEALQRGDQHLIDRFSISRAPSATVYHLCAERGGSPENRALVMGVADRRAPLIREEARVVAETLPNARLLLDEQASRENLIRHGRGCRYLHIATHGLYRQDNPMFSAIQLADARLSLLDLYSLRLEAELVVLSGCATGLSTVRGGDELVGLTRGLLYAGARSVLVTLWDVNDESTADYMRSFYRFLARGRQPAAALRRAVLELRRTRPHPYFWAPFVLIGPAEPAALS